MFCWALQFGPFVEVLEPADLRSELAAAINEMSEVYSNPAS
jgi:predicted DNA-binding transcriptional regulator YafY